MCAAGAPAAHRVARDRALAAAHAGAGLWRLRRAHEQAGRCVLWVLVWCRSRRTPTSPFSLSLSSPKILISCSHGAPNAAPAFLQIRSLAREICSMRARSARFLHGASTNSVGSARHRVNIPVSFFLSPFSRQGDLGVPPPQSVDLMPLARLLWKRRSISHVPVDRCGGDRRARPCVGTAAARPTS